jgi:hypothetical protein
MGFDVYSDRYGKRELLGCRYASEQTARRACRRYFEADGNSASFPRARYWIESDDAPGKPVGKVYGGSDNP